MEIVLLPAEYDALIRYNVAIVIRMNRIKSGSRTCAVGQFWKARKDGTRDTTMVYVRKVTKGIIPTPNKCLFRFRYIIRTLTDQSKLR